MTDRLPLLWCVLVALTLTTTGCSTWQPVPYPDLSARGTTTPGRARVTTTDGVRFTLDDTRLAPDSLYGFDERVGRIRAIPASLVNRLEVRSFSPGLTLGLTALFVGIVFGIAALNDFGWSNARWTPPAGR